MRILVPVDGSENSMHAVEFIASRTTLLGSNPEIEVLNVQDFDFRIAPEKRGAAGDEFHGVHAVFTAVNGNENAHITS